MTPCINLREKFGDRYRVEYEESYHAEHGDGARSDDPMQQSRRCQACHICPGGDGRLMACTDLAGPISKRLKALEFAAVVQDGSDGANVLFPIDRFDEVAAIMKPRRRRRLSEQHKEKLMAASRDHWFAPGSGGPGAARKPLRGTRPL